jgi:hypothetical protein
VTFCREFRHCRNSLGDCEATKKEATTAKSTFVNGTFGCRFFCRRRAYRSSFDDMELTTRAMVSAM